MLLSIIISSHNRGKEAVKLVEDINKYLLFGKTLRRSVDFEVVVVDYDSDDVIDVDARVISATRHPYEFKKGLSINHIRNIGAECSYGEWLMFLDADLRLSEKTMSAVLAQISDGDPNTVYGGVRYKLNHAGSIIATDPPDYHKPNISLYGFCMIFHRSAFLRLGGFNEGIRGWGDDDIEMMSRAFKMGMQSKVIPHAIFKHPLHAEASWHGEKEPFPLIGGYKVDQVTEFEFDRDKYIQEIRALKSKNTEFQSQIIRYETEMDTLISVVENQQAALEAKNARLENIDRALGTNEPQDDSPDTVSYPPAKEVSDYGYSTCDCEDAADKPKRGLWSSLLKLIGF